MPPGPAGLWQIESSPGAATWTAALRVDGRRLVGVVSSCASADGAIEIFQGFIDGNTVTFKCRSFDGNRTVSFTGTVRGDEITFVWERVGPGAVTGLFGVAAPRTIIVKRVLDTADAKLTAAADRIPKSRGVTFDRIMRADEEPHNWLTYSRTLNGARHTPLTQITTTNVKDLELAWIWQQSQEGGRFEATPLVVDGVMYTVQAPNDVVALDAATGRVLWTHPYTPDPRARASGGGGRPNRGLAILGGTLFLGTLDAHLLAIDAHSGKLLWNTMVADAADPGCKGICYNITHAPLVVKDKVIVGVGGGDHETVGVGIRGFVAAFDATTGTERWRFLTVPATGEHNNDTWSGESWRTGGAGVWNTGSYDPDLNLTYWGTGNPTPVGVYGPPLAHTRLGDNLYSASVVALDADTGALKWHYQFTPHDDMDWDAAQVPVLADITFRGRPRKAMLFANKNGLMYVLDRATGEFLAGTPFVEVNWMSGFDDKGRPIRVSGIASGREGVRILPGGATNWQPASYSTRTGLFYIASSERARMNGLLVLGPGYGAVRAFDPTTGEKKWEFRVNDVLFSAGVLTTASDVLFTGVAGDFRSEPAAARREDRYFYALDARDGRRLWRMALDGTVQGGPMSYAIEGRQFVAVTAGNSLFAFALRQ